MVRESTKRAIAKYQKESVRNIRVKFYPKDHDVYEYIKASCPEGLNKTIISMLREDMERAIKAGEYEAQCVTTGREEATEDDAGSTGEIA